MSKSNPFEQYFRDFVASFGGTVLDEAPTGKTADYLFKDWNVIAELKTMLEDSSDEMNKKIGAVVNDWTRETGQLPTGTVAGSQYIVEMKSVEPEIVSKWFNMLRQAVERYIKEADHQIRDTKIREQMPNARGIILIGNLFNKYHNEPEDFRRIVADILRKKGSNGELRFPHIQGAVYFSAGEVKSAKENMYFWTPMQMKRTPDEDVTDIVNFQRNLRQCWYEYITQTTGIQIRQHNSDNSSVS